MKLSNLKTPLTCNISPYRKAFECGRTHHRSSTSARWRGHSREPCGRLCHRCSTAAPSPSLAPCSPGKCDHSCGSCSTLDTEEVVEKKVITLIPVKKQLIQKIRITLHTILSLVTVPGHVSLVSTPITEQLCNVKNNMEINIVGFFYCIF